MVLSLLKLSICIGIADHKEYQTLFQNNNNHIFFERL